MKLSEELSWRGLVNQTTYRNLAALDDGSISFYLGCDPSSDSLTIGNLASLMLVRHFIDHGHKAYMLIGGATGMIGDPDGKATERDLLTLEQIDSNKKSISRQYERVLGGDKFQMVDNYDWFKDINYLDFLRNIGKHVPMSQMLGRDFVRSRLGDDGSGISYAEFSYSLIQGYDFLHLFRQYGVTLQLCGADQWGNSVTGVDLIRRLENKEANVYSVPLVVNKATGVKFGKSEEGAVWLDEKKTSVFRFYQFWLNADDAGVIDYLKIYTLLNKDQIDDLEKQLHENPGERAAQKALAYEVTKIVHGEDRVRSAQKVTSVLFGKGSFDDLSEQDIEELAKEIPVVDSGKTLVDLMVESGLSTSNSDARRLISSGAVSINGQIVSDDQIVNKPSLIKRGKNNFALVR